MFRMESRLDTLTKLVENENFNEFSIYFFDKSRTIREVAKIIKESKKITGKITSISPTTIYDFKNKLNDFGKKQIKDNYFKLDPNSFARKKEFYMDSTLLVAYFGEKLGLSLEEKKILEEFLSTSDIYYVIKNKNANFDFIIGKVVLMFTLIKGISGKNFQGISIENLLINLKLKDIEILKDFSEKEIDNFGLSIQKLLNEKKDNINLKTLTDKMINLDYTINFLPIDFLKMITTFQGIFELLFSSADRNTQFRLKKQMEKAGWKIIK